MDLSAYISFAIVMDKPNGVIRLVDTSNYPPSVNVLVKGCFTAITQPDLITVGNSNFASPDIQWNGTSLPPVTYELRPNTSGGFQTGGYSITYQVQAAGYSPTTLIKTFNLNYTKPVAVIISNFDNFTPKLTVQDGTAYAQSGFNLVSVAETWSGVINSVAGTPQNISGSGPIFDLAYLGNYYDASFSVSLSSVFTYTLVAPANWVTIIDSFSLSQVFDSETPPTLVLLLSYLTFLKAQMDAAECDCNTYPTLFARYIKAQAIYSHLKYRGCNNDLAGLSSYVYQLQKIFNNNITPPVNHTLVPIPSYDWGCGGSGGSVAWNNITGKPATVIIQWTVGDAGFPGNGATQLTDSRLSGYNVLILRNNIQEENYTKPLAGSTITFNNALSTEETIYCQSIPL